jgi:hypothetical protein
VGSGAVAASAEIRLKKKRTSGRMKRETGWQTEGFNLVVVEATAATANRP